MGSSRIGRVDDVEVRPLGNDADFESTSRICWAKLAVFFGTLFVTGGAVQITRLSIPKVKRWRHPPMLSVISHNGDRLILTLTHSGERTVWQVRRRITKMLYVGPNPSPEPQLCILRKDGKALTDMPMEDGETASIILVYPYSSEWHSRPWILELGYAHSGGHGDQFVGEKGVIIEVEIKAIPPLKDGPTRLCYKVFRRNTNDIIIAEDVPCEKFQVL
jgi:hypothetical protein